MSWRSQPPLGLVICDSDVFSRMRPNPGPETRLRTAMTKQLSVGDWVEVRSKEEILETLDADGMLDGMPFMPEMLQYCGQRFRVQKSAHKTCDYTTSYPFRSRRLERTVHLDTRCDGAAHGGCQAGCLLYWNESWLKPAANDESHVAKAHDEIVSRTRFADRAQCSELVLYSRTSVVNPDGTTRYLCQATQIPFATTALAWWDVRQYVKDYWSGNVALGRIVYALIYSSYYNLSQAGIGVGRPMRWLYDKFRWVWRGSRWPRTPGALPEGCRTPAATLNLQPGEWVRVKSHEEILQTVTATNLNRGMYWDAELVPYCGGVYRVLRQVTKLIDEKTGQMLSMKTPCIVLDSVVCQARYSACRMLCPKGMYPYWREIWLDRVSCPDGFQQRHVEDQGSAEPKASERVLVHALRQVTADTEP